MNEYNQKINQYFIKHQHNYVCEYGPVEDYLFFNGHLFYAVECSIYKDNHKILDVPKYHDKDFICKLVSIDKESILLVALDSGYILSYRIQNDSLTYKNSTKIYECNLERDLELSYYDQEYLMIFIDDLEVENNIVTINLNIKKEYYKFDVETGLLKKLISSDNN
jgi:hypothetical protein